MCFYIGLRRFRVALRGPLRLAVLSGVGRIPICVDGNSFHQLAGSGTVAVAICLCHSHPLVFLDITISLTLGNPFARWARKLNKIMLQLSVVGLGFAFGLGAACGFVSRHALVEFVLGD